MESNNNLTTRSKLNDNSNQESENSETIEPNNNNLTTQTKYVENVLSAYGYENNMQNLKRECAKFAERAKARRRYIRYNRKLHRFEKIKAHCLNGLCGDITNNKLCENPVDYEKNLYYCAKHSMPNEANYNPLFINL